MPAIAAGTDIDAFCNRCELVLAHVIIAVSGSRPVKVECKTCRSVHAYKSSRPKPTSSAAKKTAATGVSAGDYDKLLGGKDLSRAKRYKLDETFTAGDVLDHKSFGLGVVTRLLSGGKVEVLFRDGPKVLVHVA